MLDLNISVEKLKKNINERLVSSGLSVSQGRAVNTDQIFQPDILQVKGV